MRFNFNPMVESHVVSMASRLATVSLSKHMCLDEHRVALLSLASVFEIPEDWIMRTFNEDGSRTNDKSTMFLKMAQWNIAGIGTDKLLLWQTEGTGFFRHYVLTWDDEQFIATYVPEQSYVMETHEQPPSWNDVAQALDELEVGGSVDELNEEGKRKYHSFRKYLDKILSIKPKA